MFRKNQTQSSSDPRELIVEREPKSPISEMFRTIRTNITYSSVDTSVKSVLFTSATPDAGKSTIAANMAIAYAQAGNKTILVDADLRRPTTHYTFEMPNQRGLSTSIVNEVPMESIIRESETENLDVVTSGPVPPNPAELLSSKKMGHFLKTVSQQYDMVILDSPPILAVTDAQLLSKEADGTILVTDTEANNRDSLAQAKDLLEKADANILGVVLNNKKMDNKKDSYYYYYGSE
ncbi:CpsD/CapB family tyrosine-protein kinase [Salinicoccus albus]|uniref:CpsD/CapB family tyrosine-protein kinase n=1 Tax=Salinicoccus albus TaxID=418756 RepID=UPI00035E75B1|nr:CpsD/CapB family tyrosine-protein kinase [Salinicoccus albus]